MDFYVYLNGTQRGPFVEERIQSFLDHGLLQPGDLASDRSDGEWRPLLNFRRFRTADSTPAPVTQPEVSFTPPPPTAMKARVAPAPIEAGVPVPLSALGPYARTTLAPNETPFFKTSLHWFIFVRFAVAGIVLFLFAAIPFAVAVQIITGSQLGWFVLPFPIFVLVPPAAAFASNEIVLTDRRMLMKTGVIHRQTAEMFVSKIESIGVEQTFLGRMFDFGTVRIRGTGGFEEAFDCIAHPIPFRNWVQRLQSGEPPPSIAAPASSVA
ncbi:MAG: PH domain-containing protein [Chthoniobacterales bacterium]